jgi:hypothetical protein
MLTNRHNRRNSKLSPRVRIYGGANYKYENSAYIRTKFHILSRHVSGIQNKLEGNRYEISRETVLLKLVFKSVILIRIHFSGAFRCMYIHMYSMSSRCAVLLIVLYILKKGPTLTDVDYLCISPVSRDPSSAVFDKLGNLSTMWNESGPVFCRLRPCSQAFVTGSSNLFCCPFPRCLYIVTAIFSVILNPIVI